MEKDEVLGYGFLYGIEESEDIYIACLESDPPKFSWKPWEKELDLKDPVCFWSSDKNNLVQFLKSVPFIEISSDDMEKIESDSCIAVPLKKDYLTNSIWIG